MTNGIKTGLAFTGTIACALIIFIGMTTLGTTDPTLSDFEAIEIGTKQADIHEKFGEPVGTLSGLYGDIFEVADKRIILYYDFNPDGGFPMTEVRVVDKK